MVQLIRYKRISKYYAVCRNHYVSFAQQNGSVCSTALALLKINTLPKLDRSRALNFRGIFANRDGSWVQWTFLIPIITIFGIFNKCIA